MTAVGPYRGVRNQDKFVKFFNEVQGAVRRESVTQLESPLNPL